MILIEGIPVVTARLVAEQKAKEWLAKTRSSAPPASNQKASVTCKSAAVRRSAKAA